MSFLSRRAGALYGYASILVDDSPYMGHEQSRGIYDPEVVSAVYSPSSVTGLPESDAGKIADPSLSHAEREKIMSRLAGMSEGRGVYLPSSLSDDDVLSLLPPRYVQDDVDIQRWRDYLSRDVIPYMSDEVQNISEEVETKVETVEDSKVD